jgi:RNA polymerase sigma-70 factor (ECF subfamily)
MGHWATGMSFESDLLVWLPQLRRYARALTGDAAWADDLVQDTLECALNKWRWRANSNLHAWLLTLLRHRFIDQLRARHEIAVDDETAPWQSMAAPSGEVDGLELEDVQRALYRLPVEQREVLLLVGLEELSYQEAAVVLKVPIGTVMSRLSRARERMRILLDEGGDREAVPVRAPLKVVKKWP